MGNVDIIKDAEGNNIVVINDLRFKSRRRIDWNEIEACLKEYVGNHYEIIETSEDVYIGNDFPDEFAHSESTKKQRGANEKAKANIASSIGTLINNATDRQEYPDYEEKHRKRAKYGWHRYNTRFAIPVYDEDGEILRYNVFLTRMLVRCDEDGKKYLYDFVRFKKYKEIHKCTEKKEACEPLEP